MGSAHDLDSWGRRFESCHLDQTHKGKRVLKIFLIVMLLSPGAAAPLIKREQVDSYETCIAEILKVKEKAEELNTRGGPIAEFTVVGACEFVSERSDPA